MESFFSFFGRDLVSQLKMPDSSNELKETYAKVREDSEYVRLVVPSELRKSEADILESQRQEIKGSHMWWAKTILWCSFTVIILFIFVKWGLPFLVKKVLEVLSFLVTYHLPCYFLLDSADI